MQDRLQFLMVVMQATLHCTELCPYVKVAPTSCNLLGQQCYTMLDSFEQALNELSSKIHPNDV